VIAAGEGLPDLDGSFGQVVKSLHMNRSDHNVSICGEQVE
jgi:hypothetical protein